METSTITNIFQLVLRRKPKEQPKTLLDAYHDIIVAYDNNEIPHDAETTKFYMQLKDLIKELNDTEPKEDVKLGDIFDAKT